jgi:hypothetical protein
MFAFFNIGAQELVILGFLGVVLIGGLLIAVVVMSQQKKDE